MNKDFNNEPEKEYGVGKPENQAAADTETEIENKKSKKKAAFYKKRSFKFGSMATAFTAIFIAIIILLNVGLTIASKKFPLSIDLTSAKNYQLSNETLSYISKLKSPIVIKMFATQAQFESIDKNYLGGANKLIEQYPKHSSNITLQYIDYDKNPTAASAYKNVSQYDVVVSTKSSDGTERYKKIGASDLMVTQTNSSTYQQTVIGNKAEQQIDAAIDYVTSKVHPTVLFTTGHDEQDSSSYQSLLKDANYNIEQINIASKSIDKKASAIVICDPQADFSSSEIDAIDKFLKNDGKYGKNIFIYLDPRVQSLPNLEEYISEWGVKVEKGAVYDNTNSYNNIFDPIASDVDSDSTGISSSTNIGTDVRLTKPLSLIFESKDNRTVKSIIKTGDSSQLLADITKETSSSDKKGPFTAMTLSTWSASGSDSKSNMVVSGSFEFLDSDLLSATNKNNKNILLGIANKLLGKQSSISIASKYDTSTNLSLSMSQRYFALITLVIIVPLAILAIGLIQWLRRRHL